MTILRTRVCVPRIDEHFIKISIDSPLTVNIKREQEEPSIFRYIASLLKKRLIHTAAFPILFDLLKKS